MLLHFGRLRPESKDMLHLDCLRLIASAGIIVLHMGTRLQGRFAPSPKALEPLSLFVDLFFVISGFVIAYVYFERISSVGGYLGFLRKRIARLGPLHWLLLVIFFALGLAAARAGVHVDHQDIFDLRCFLPNIFFLQAADLCGHLSFNAPAWSISAEFFMYLAAPAFFYLARRGSVLILTFTIGILMALTAIMHGSQWLNWTEPYGPLRAVPSFCFGIFLFSIRTRLTLRYGEVAMWSMLALFVVGVVLNVNGMMLLLLLYAIVVVSVGADRSGHASRLTHIFAAGGQLTYSSYMLHSLILVVLVNGVAEHLFHLHGVAIDVWLLFVLAIIWPVSYLSLVAFETPLRKLLSGQNKPSPADTGL